MGKFFKILAEYTPLQFDKILNFTYPHIFNTYYWLLKKIEIILKISHFFCICSHYVIKMYIVIELMGFIYWFFLSKDPNSSTPSKGKKDKKGKGGKKDDDAGDRLSPDGSKGTAQEQAAKIRESGKLIDLPKVIIFISLQICNKLHILKLQKHVWRSRYSRSKASILKPSKFHSFINKTF